MRKKIEIVTNDVIKYVGLFTDIPHESINTQSNLVFDLGYDSLSLFNLIEKLESSYDIAINEADFLRLNTVEDIICYLNKKEIRIHREQ